MATRFAGGAANLLAGASGIELAHRTLEEVGLSGEFREQKPRPRESQEYWTGWALCHYQWESLLPFREIDRAVPVEKIRDMYHPYHEMDLRQFSEAMDEMLDRERGQTALARFRKYAEMSQSMLAKQAGVPVRTIQQYEQRQKDISKAGVENVERLARTLRTTVESLIG